MPVLLGIQQARQGRVRRSGAIASSWWWSTGESGWQKGM